MVRRIDVAEPEFESMLVKSPESIEEDMSIYDHQISTDSGPLDILGVDDSGAPKHGNRWCRT